MARTTTVRLVHFCSNCGVTFPRGKTEMMVYACGNCPTYPTYHATVTFDVEIPDPDPLDALLEDTPK